ncbi:hypothetical protein GF327_06810 [Candidatus Woesearchaeota archaeon]|nr:hypothetical protein [Candidatus Woesearchaeota archaeon]
MNIAVVVLGGGINRDSTLPDTVKKRVEKSVQTFLSKKVDYLIFSSKISVLQVHSPGKTEAQAMYEYAVYYSGKIKKKLRKEKIIKEEKSLDTVGNAYFTSKILKNKNINKIYLVSSDFHIKRAERIFKKLLGKKFKIEPVSVKTALSDQELKKINEFKDKPWIIIDKFKILDYRLLTILFLFIGLRLLNCYCRIMYLIKRPVDPPGYFLGYS